MCPGGKKTYKIQRSCGWLLLAGTNIVVEDPDHFILKTRKKTFRCRLRMAWRKSNLPTNTGKHRHLKKKIQIIREKTAAITGSWLALSKLIGFNLSFHFYLPEIDFFLGKKLIWRVSEQKKHWSTIISSKNVWFGKKHSTLKQMTNTWWWWWWTCD